MPPIRFDNGEAYERGMAVWSQLAGQVFLDWLAPPAGLRWIDVGCGNGAFTELVARRCAPSELQAIDPSEPQLAFARGRPTTPYVLYHLGDAMALPFPDRQFDAAVMALVLFFVPDPAKGVAELVRVVRPGGLVCAYVWDIEGGGFPVEPIRAALRAQGQQPMVPPRSDVSANHALTALWNTAGLEAVQTTQIEVQRQFDDFDAFWNASMMLTGLGAMVAQLADSDAQIVRDRVRQAMPPDAAGRVTGHARANAIRGRVPG